MIRLVVKAVLVLAAGLMPAADAWSAEPGYQVSNLPSASDGYSAGSSINDRSWVAGPSTLASGVRHATLWRDGSRFDLGTLGGPTTSSSVAWPVKNTRGMIAGISQTDTVQPRGERWSCAFFLPKSDRTCVGFVWEGGQMRPLDTFPGGDNAFATGVNLRGQVVGWAENGVEDPKCTPPQVLQFRGAIWEPDHDRTTELLPLPGDTSSAATAINDRGEAVGISGICDQAVGRRSAIHAVRWERGKVEDIGDLGGVAWNTPMAINQRGDIVGFANDSEADGIGFNPQAVMWTRRHGIRRLPRLSGDAISQALGVNNRRQIVGISCTKGFASCRAFLYEDGAIADLNGLVTGAYGDHLYTANDINDRGQITGEAVTATTGASVAFEAEPHGRPASAAARRTRGRVALPPGAREQLLARSGVRSRHRDATREPVRMAVPSAGGHPAASM